MINTRTIQWVYDAHSFQHNIHGRVPVVTAQDTMLLYFVKITYMDTIYCLVTCTDFNYQTRITSPVVECSWVFFLPMLPPARAPDNALELSLGVVTPV